MVDLEVRDDGLEVYGVVVHVDDVDGDVAVVLRQDSQTQRVS